MAKRKTTAAQNNEVSANIINGADTAPAEAEGYANGPSIQEDVAIQEVVFDPEQVYEARFGFIKDQDKFLMVRLTEQPSEVYRMYVTDSIMRMLYAMIMRKHYYDVDAYTAAQFIQLLKHVAAKAKTVGKTMPTIKVTMHQLGKYWVANLYIPEQPKIKDEDIEWI